MSTIQLSASQSAAAMPSVPAVPSIATAATIATVPPIGTVPLAKAPSVTQVTGAARVTGVANVTGVATMPEFAAVADDEQVAAVNLSDAVLRSTFAWAQHRYRQASGRPGHAMIRPSCARFVELQHEFLRRFPGAGLR